MWHVVTPLVVYAHLVVVQGTLLKRHLIAKRAASGDDVEYFGWQDLFVGNEVTFYGRCVARVPVGAAPPLGPTAVSVYCT